MIYHTEWKERGLKGLWFDAAAAGSALLVLSATNAAGFVVLLGWFACSVLNRASRKRLGEILFPEEAEESEAWSKIFPMLWPEEPPGDNGQALLLSRIKWFINPASWALSFLRFLEWGLLKADSFLKQREPDTINLSLIFLINLSQTVLKGVSILVEGVEGLLSFPYWMGYGLFYVFGFRPPPPPRGDEMVPWDPNLKRNRSKAEVQPLVIHLDPAFNPMEAGPVVYKLIMELGEVSAEEKEEQRPGLSLPFHEFSKYDHSPVGRNNQGYYQAEIRYQGQILLYQMEPLFFEVYGCQLRAEDWATRRQIEEWYKAHKYEHIGLQLQYIRKKRRVDWVQMEAKMYARMALEQTKMAAVRAEDLAKAAEKNAVEKKKIAEANEEKANVNEANEKEANEKEGSLAEKNALPFFLKFLQGEARRAREAADEAKEEANKAQQEAEKARQEATRAQETAEEARRAFERQYPSESGRRGSGQEFFSNKEGAGRKLSAENSQNQEQAGGYTPG